MTLSAGLLAWGPAFTQEVLPVELVSMAEAAAPVQWNVGTDFTNNVNDGWSEVKLENAGAAAGQLDLTGYNTFSFNLYYKPENMTQGSFKLKLYVKSADDQEVINLCPDIDLGSGKDAGNGMKCVPVQVNFKPVEAKTAYFCLSLVGCNTDYKGDLYVGQLKLSTEKVPDGYVAAKVAAKKQDKVQLGQLALPGRAALTDAKATPETAKLFAYFKGIAQSDKVLYGHQNELHKKVAKNLPGASDTEDMVGDGSGCTVVPQLSQEKNGGESGLAFHYSINKGGTPVSSRA